MSAWLVSTTPFFLFTVCCLYSGRSLKCFNPIMVTCCYMSLGSKMGFLFLFSFKASVNQIFCFFSLPRFLNHESFLSPGCLLLGNSLRYSKL